MTRSFDSAIAHTVSPGEQGMRLDVLVGGFPEVASRSAAVKLIESGDVLVNGEPASKKRIVLAGDEVSYLPPAPVPEAPEVTAQYIPLDIRYEDDDLIVLSKQAGLVCHPSVGHESWTLANALLEHCGPDHVGMLQGADRPGIVHRLDRDTTGLMLAAKSDESQAALQDGIRMRTVDRRYLALVHGYIAPDTGLIDSPIARDPKDRQRMAVSQAEGARSCVTTFTVLERFEAGLHDQGYTLLECKLYTGRTHQIRVHMASINHPCVGDPLYGVMTRGRASKRDPRQELGLERQFLHSYRLCLEHPESGEPLRFVDDLPDDLREVLDGLASRSMGRTRTGERFLAELSGLPRGPLDESVYTRVFGE